MSDYENARQVLKKYWGYDDFRPGQEALVRALLSGRDVLGIMPTGAGKSICYEVPALLFPGITIVVSPLLSLMEDQVESLRRRGIPAAAISSLHPLRELSPPFRILYVSPERLTRDEFRRFIFSYPVSFLCVDEAHCISKWGHGFRPEYTQIHTFIDDLRKRSGSLRVAAFTATADARIREEILRELHLQKPYCLATGFDRPNLFFAVERPKDRRSALLFHIRRHPGECGIIYCQTRKTVEKVARHLKRAGISAEKYHAGMTPEERNAVQQRFMDGETPVIAATNAFGMGVDKPDVRFVIHYNMPKDMESYYQEAGRAGRDGFPAECILFYHPKDVKTGNLFIDREAENAENKKALRSHKASEREKLRTMDCYAAGRVCLRAFMLEYFGEHAPSFCGKCSVCLSGELPVNEAGRKKLLRGACLRTPESSAGLSPRQYELYCRLLALRSRLAGEKRCSPDKIFNDRILRSLCTALPVSMRELLMIDGISPLTAFRYGKAFLKEIRTHLYIYPEERPFSSS
ncbi:MAG: ATP-dependent DNA helicase RecQ [Lachnospiraceae bacterium]|nr:ATP-dependent DNA helicase RecQ [Lachnospiraceae bacterium]